MDTSQPLRQAQACIMHRKVPLLLPRYMALRSRFSDAWHSKAAWCMSYGRKDRRKARLVGSFFMGARKSKFARD